MRYRSVLLALFSLLASVPAFAGDIRGVIVRVDLDRHEVQIEGRGLGKRGLGMTFGLGKDTRVLLGRDAGDLSDLTPGRRVRVVYDGPRAISVEVSGLRRAGGSDVQPRGPVPAPGPKEDANTVAGMLQRVSYAEREVVVIGPGPKGPETETIVSVPKDVRVVKDGKPIAFEDLKDNQPAMIQTEKRDGKLLAKSIQVGQGVAAMVPLAPEPRTRLARLRRLLQIADRILEMAEGTQEEPPRPKRD
ncbi:MAG: hypothetical protein HYS12_22575 [Planctomycetes bacterium]|nr:hypothetical protein [Planctomycetota bacterium]